MTGAPRVDALQDELLDRMRTGRFEDLDDLALRILRRQARDNPVQAALIRARGLDPARLRGWKEFPPIPVRAFRDHPVYCGEPGSEEARFRTSGTTRSGHRGLHRVRSLALYHASLRTQAERYLAHPTPRRVIALLPSPLERPDSSLVHMAGVLHGLWDDGGGDFFADAEWELRTEALAEALGGAERDGVPTLVLGTAFAWVHWLERGGARLTLPDGSTLMETGGFKGRSRHVPPGELYAALSARLGLPVDRMINEYGMTEMLSQFWEPALRGGGGGPGARVHEGPPWVRTRVLDPVTLDPVGEGEPGLLCHLDLANLHSASLLLTEDRGIRVGTAPGGGPVIRLMGRVPGAEARGCSLVMEELLEASGG